MYSVITDMQPAVVEGIATKEIDRKSCDLETFCSVRQKQRWFATEIKLYAEVMMSMENLTYS